MAQPPFAPTPHVPEIGPHDAHALVVRGHARLLDVREPHEWDSGHAPQADHLPLGRVHPTAVPGDLPLIMVCRSGARSARAAELLAAAGLRAHNLAGGMAAWARAGLPVTRDDGRAGTVA